MLHDYHQNFKAVRNILGENLSQHFLNKALSKFNSNQFCYFDPHVGDTSCQIRACMFIYLKLTGFGVGVFQKSNHLNLCSSVDDALKYFLMCSYILTEFSVRDEFGGSSAIEIKKLSSFCGFSNTKTKNLVRMLQKDLSKFSCDFIINLAHQLNIEYSEYIEFLKLEGDDGRFLLPCFVISDVILRFIKKNNICINVQINYRDGAKRKSFISNSFSKKFLINMICYSNYMSSFHDDLSRKLKTNFDEIFYANQAFHPQYCGLKTIKYRNLPFSILNEKLLSVKEIYNLKNLYDRYRSIAIKKGFCSTASQKIRIMHFNAMYFSDVEVDLTSARKPAYSVNMMKMI